MTPRLPALRPRQVPRALERSGFIVHHTTGSHYILKHPHQPYLRVTLAFHRKDLKRKTLETIIKQAELTTEEFIAWL